MIRLHRCSPSIALCLLLLAPVAAAAQEAPDASAPATTAAAPTPAEAAPAEAAPAEAAPADPAPAAAAPPEAAPREVAPAEAVPTPAEFGRYWATISLGFSHWFGGTFGAPAGSTTPGLTLGFVPTEWLELQLAYSVSVVPLLLPDETQGHVGYLTLALLVRRELVFARERLMFGCGILGGIVHTETGVREAIGTVIAARYLVLVADGFSIGPFVDARLVQYELPESPVPLYEIRDGQLISGHSDLHVHMGVAMAF